MNITEELYCPETGDKPEPMKDLNPLQIIACIIWMARNDVTSFDWFANRLKRGDAIHEVINILRRKELVPYG